MRWPVALFVLFAFTAKISDDAPAAQFYLLGAVLLVLVEIANSVRKQ